MAGPMVLLSTSEFFSTYEEDYHRIARDLSDHIASLGTSNDASGNIAKAERLLQDGNNCLRHMELEVKSLPPSSSQTLKLRSMRTDLSDLSRQLQAAAAKVQRTALRGPQKGDGSSSSGLVDAGRVLKDSTKRLEESRRLAVDTEELGINIMGNMRSQRETILRAKHHVDETDSQLNRAKKVLNAMSRRVLSNRAILYAAIFVLVWAICLVLYSKISRYYRILAMHHD